MKHSRRLVFTTTVVFAFAGCGGQVSLTGGTVSTGAMLSNRAHHGSSSRGALLYVAMYGRLAILTYPGLTKVAEVRGEAGGVAASDPNNGNVMFTYGEFAHGATKPFAQLNLASGEYIEGASFDPTTDNIAFSLNGGTGSRQGLGIDLFKNLNDPPSLYTDPEMAYYGPICYDGHGDLFILGKTVSGAWSFAELPKGASQFTNFSNNETLNDAYELLWDGTYIVVRTGSILYRVTFSGSTITVVGSTSLDGAFNSALGDRFAIQGNSVVGSHLGGGHSHSGRVVALWHYPKGGPAYKIMRGLAQSTYSMAVSVAPSGARIHK